MPQIPYYAYVGQNYLIVENAKNWPKDRNCQNAKNVKEVKQKLKLFKQIDFFCWFSLTASLKNRLFFSCFFISIVTGLPEINAFTYVKVIVV